MTFEAPEIPVFAGVERNKAWLFLTLVFSSVGYYEFNEHKFVVKDDNSLYTRLQIQCDKVMQKSTVSSAAERHFDPPPVKKWAG